MTEAVTIWTFIMEVLLLNLKGGAVYSDRAYSGIS